MKHAPDMNFLFSLADYAGEVMLANFNSISKMDIETKADTTPVTIADNMINTYVIDQIKAKYPHISIIAEEGNAEIENAEYSILCDPIDGTIPYTLGIPISTFCITLLYRGIPLKTCIYDPFLKRLWHAEKGMGSFLNQKNKLQVSNTRFIKDSNIHFCWWKGSKYNLEGICEHIRSEGGKWLNLATIGCVGGLIASGHIDASIFPGDKAWETAAMKLLVEEAGGKVTHIDGSPIENFLGNSIKGHIISNGLLHDWLPGIVDLHQ
jgi:myo-inositol-1(or 4)-monophosphatase